MSVDLDAIRARHAAFIAASRADVRDLLAMVDELRALIELGRRAHSPRCEALGPYWSGLNNAAVEPPVVRRWCATCGADFDPDHQPHPCNCGAAEHNTAIDKALGSEQDAR